MLYHHSTTDPQFRNGLLLWRQADLFKAQAEQAPVRRSRRMTALATLIFTVLGLTAGLLLR